MNVSISIHAPPRGATSYNKNIIVIPHISIHAPPRGATAVWVDKGLFNDISIHAPPRGATAGGAAQAPQQVNFNSRPSARGDCGG